MKNSEGTLVHGWLGPMSMATEARAGRVPARNGQGEGPGSAGEVRDVLLSAYWSASSQMLALEGTLSRATDPEQRRALSRLHALEAQRRELARQSAEALWGIRLAETGLGEAAA